MVEISVSGCLVLSSFLFINLLLSKMTCGVQKVSSELLHELPRHSLFPNTIEDTVSRSFNIGDRDLWIQILLPCEQEITV